MHETRTEFAYPLVHIGYHKTASTWLQKKVFNYENGFFQPCSLNELYECLVKPNALSFDAKVTADRMYNAINKRPELSGLIPALSHERLSEDPFSGSRDSKEIAQRIHTVFPKAKILIVIREQFELIASLYKTYVLHGGSASLNEFIAPLNEEEHQWFDYKTYCYDILISYYVNLYGNENVMVVTYETLKKNNDSFCKELFDFVGFDTRVPVLSQCERVNVSLGERATEMLRMINVPFRLLFAYPLCHARSMLWRNIRSGTFRLNNNFSWLNTKGNYKAQLKKVLGGKYGVSNRRLQDLLKVDLTSLGYEYSDAE